MGRPKNYDREEVLDRAMRTFWRQGYDGTSTTDLEAHTGVNRSSLYAQFQSKHQLYEQALDRYLTDVVPEFIGELGERQADVHAIETVLERFASWAGAPGTEAGCMICNAATERATDDVSCRDAVQRYVTLLESSFRNALDNAVTSGQLRADLDSVGWSRKLTTTLMGMMVFIRARVDPTLPRDAARVAIAELAANAVAAVRR